MKQFTRLSIGFSKKLENLWTMDELYEAVIERENDARQRERYDRLIAKLTGA